MSKAARTPKTKLSKAKTGKGNARSSGRFTVGIDLGGTKVAAALVDAKGVLITSARRATVPPDLAHLDPRNATALPSAKQVREHVHYVIEAMADATIEAAGAHSGEVLGIGLASAGPMNIFEGTLNYPANFIGWKKVALVRLLAEALAKRGLRKPIGFQNDAIAAALGEGWVGKASGCGTYAMITLGTGIGTGVIFNGQPAQSGGMGSEWGHLIVDATGIGKEPEALYDRSVEGLASGTGLIRRAKNRGFKGASAADLAAAAREGDPLAIEIFAGASEGLAALFFNLSIGFHPEKFVVTGGMLPIRDLFLPRAIELYRELMKRQGPDFLAPVQISQLGNLAGVIGAARLPHLSLIQ